MLGCRSISKMAKANKKESKIYRRKLSVCMIAYANYFTDARIKNYVEALLKEGYEIDVFALGSNDSAAQPGLRVFSVMEKYWGKSALRYAISQLWFTWRTALLVSWYFLKKHYCLVHVHNIPNFLVFSAIIPKLNGAKIILDVHDTMPESYATKFDLPLNHFLINMLRWEERLSAWFSDQVLTTNKLHKEVLCSHGVSKNKIDVILNVGNKRVFCPTRDRKPHNELMLVYHGTITERLGIDTILKAVALASKECHSVRFLLIGEGDFLNAAKSLINNLELMDIVQITGFVPVEELPTYLSMADVGIVGNRGYTETKHNYMLPVKMLEYTAMEIPTIAPRLRVICHYFDENCAIFYTPDDVNDMAQRIIEVCKHREIIANIREGLKVFNKRYNWSSMEKKYLNIIGRLI